MCGEPGYRLVFVYFLSAVAFLLVTVQKTLCALVLAMGPYHHVGCSTSPGYSLACFIFIRYIFFSRTNAVI